MIMTKIAVVLDKAAGIVAGLGMLIVIVMM